jgi:hypothetical protein
MIQNELFSNMLNSPVRELVGRVELYIYKDSTLIKVCGCNDALKSFTIDRVGENKFFGYGICQKLNVKLLDIDRNISISTDNYLEAVLGVENEYLYAFPSFYVTEVHRDETTNQLSVTAYDSLYDASKHTVSELEISSYTIRQFATACADLLGLPLKIDSDNTAFDLEYPDGANFDGSETIREALNAVAEVTQTIYYINNNWELTFKSLDKDGEPILTLGKKHYITLDNKNNRRLGTICHATELGDNLSASIEQTGSTQYVRDNPFWNMREDIGTLLDNAIARVGGFTINQFDCKWRGNWLLEIGDKIALTTKDDNTITSYLLNDVITYDGTLSERTQWQYDENDEETASNPTNIGDAIKQTYAKVDKVNKKIELVASDVTDNQKNISQLELDTQGIRASVSELSENINGEIATITEKQSNFDIELEEISATVSSVESTANANSEAIGNLEISADEIIASVTKIEETTNESLESINGDITTLTSKVEAQMTEEDVQLQITKELENGIDKVVTSTGYVFDETGMTISKSGSEMSTIVTEDGMTVYRSGEAVLVANNEGVQAEDLHATTYLIIGTNSRFEDYESNRTGCFWVGG